MYQLLFPQSSCQLGKADRQLSVVVEIFSPCIQNTYAHVFKYENVLGCAIKTSLDAGLERKLKNLMYWISIECAILRNTNGQQCIEKIFVIIILQENTNQNQYKIPSYSNQNGYFNKVCSQICQENEILKILLLGMQISHYGKEYFHKK